MYYSLTPVPAWAVVALVCWVLLAIALSGYFLIKAQRRGSASHARVISNKKPPDFSEG